MFDEFGSISEVRTCRPRAKQPDAASIVYVEISRPTRWNPGYVRSFFDGVLRRFSIKAAELATDASGNQTVALATYPLAEPLCLLWPSTLTGPMDADGKESNLALLRLIASLLSEGDSLAPKPTV